CYNDLLRVYLERVEQSHLAADLPDLSLMLEFGVAQVTQVSLIGLGLSRTAAVMLGELITSDDLSEAGALEWLREGVWLEADLPALVKAEVAQLLSLRATSAA